MYGDYARLPGRWSAILHAEAGRVAPRAGRRGGPIECPPISPLASLEHHGVQRPWAHGRARVGDALVVDEHLWYARMIARCNRAAHHAALLGRVQRFHCKGVKAVVVGSLGRRPCHGCVAPVVLQGLVAAPELVALPVVDRDAV